MAKANLNTQTKRKRELAKKDKRAAKDQKRALRKDGARGVSTSAAGNSATPSLSKAAAEWMKPVSKTPAARSKPSPVASAFIRSMKIGGS